MYASAGAVPTNPVSLVLTTPFLNARTHTHTHTHTRTGHFILLHDKLLLTGVPRNISLANCNMVYNK